MSPLGEAVDALPPVGLDELVAEASLLRRVDRKYVLSRADAAMVVATMPRQARALDIGARRLFDYRSLYFDTPARDCFVATAHRRRRRFKVRTREYRDSGGSFLEVKTRSSRVTVKRRIPWAGHELDAAGRGFVRTALDREAMTAADPDALRPVLRTAYRRATLYLPGEGIRVTVDSDLIWADADDPANALRRPGLAILETKTAGPTSSVDRLLWSLGNRPVAISKYATGLAALHPELPRNRWHRLLASTLTPDTVQA